MYFEKRQVLSKGRQHPTLSLQKQSWEKKGSVLNPKDPC